ncbi:MAG: molybdopterin-dependent oxidoreductase [Ardenticatenia bacterium]|nr:molybdopterin-dependent oxidoreductase [Ardenticatenia bacterium]
MPTLRMNVNGQPVEVDVVPDAFLAHVLRYRLGLTGTKIGCEEAECGACTVLIDGQPVNSCIFPALKAHGTRVVTIEGLSNGELHPLQQAFVEWGAVQCGFCTPGVIMVAKALLDRSPAPTEEAIRAALKDTYCRCGCYLEMVDAILVASGQAPRHTAINGHPPASPKALRAVGRPLPRPDAVAKVTGQAKYTDDYAFPNMLYGATLRSAYPHARLVRVETHRAKALPGVHAVLTAEDIPGEKHHGLMFDDWPVLCYDKVRYVGDAIAIVAADTPEIARRALELIDVEYDPLPVVTTPQEALAPGAPKVHGGGNLLKHIKVRKGDVEAGFAEADVIVERDYHTPMYEHAFLEPECAIARVAEDGRIEVIVGSQIPYEDRRQIARSLGVPEDHVRVKGAFVGGGFGGKEDIAGQIHAALLARATGQPVKILYSRQESLRVHPKRHATWIRVRLGATRDGRLVAAEVDILGDAGAYASLSDKVMTRAATHAAGPYDIPHVRVDCYTAYTNNPPAGAFRGFGVTQSAFAIESTLDVMAHELGRDPLELRLRNALRPGATTSTGQVLRESVGLVSCLEHVGHHLRSEQGPEWWHPFPNPDDPARVRAWGLAACYKNTGLGGGAPDWGSAEVEVLEDGRAVVRTAAAEIGQGLPAVLAIIVAEELGIPYEHIEVALPDTDTTPDGGPTTASRQTYINGNAARMAAQRVRDILAWAACEALGAPQAELVFRDGLITARGRAMAVGEAARMALEAGRRPVARARFEAPPTQPLGQGGDMHVGFSFGVQAALVEVDTRTGEVAVLKVVNAHDIGRAINMLGLLGQIRGGIIMGIGNALTEEYPVDEGIPFCTTLSRYKMPSIRHAPEIITFLVEDELPSGPYGAKGVGEIASIPTAAAVANAVYHAVGIRVTKTPLDQDWLLRALRGQQGTPSAKPRHHGGHQGHQGNEEHAVPQRGPKDVPFLPGQTRGTDAHNEFGRRQA